MRSRRPISSPDGGQRRGPRRGRRRRTLVSAGAVVAAVAMVAAIGALRGGDRGALRRVVVDGPSRSDPIPVGRPAPDFTAPLVGGGEGSLVDDVPGPALLVFWAPWCPHCRDELPVVERLHRDSPGLSVGSVVIWAEDRPGPSPEEVMRGAGASFPAFLDDPPRSIADAYGIRATPTLYLLDGELRVVEVLTGAVPEPVLRERLAPIT